MLSKEKTENATRAYINSYNVAMEMTRNPNLAVQIATNVIMVMLVAEPKEPAFNPFQAIIEQMVQAQSEGRKEENDRTENEAD